MPDDCIVLPNKNGNLMILAAGSYIGYIDMLEGTVELNDGL
jgi:hypothetical protein